LIPALSSSGRELCLVRMLAASSFQQKFVISTQRIPFDLKGLGKTPPSAAVEVESDVPPLLIPRLRMNLSPLCKVSSGLVQKLPPRGTRAEVGWASRGLELCGGEPASTLPSVGWSWRSMGLANPGQMGSPWRAWAIQVWEFSPGVKKGRGGGAQLPPWPTSNLDRTLWVSNGLEHPGIPQFSDIWGKTNPVSSRAALPQCRRHREEGSSDEKQSVDQNLAASSSRTAQGCQALSCFWGENSPNRHCASSSLDAGWGRWFFS